MLKETEASGRTNHIAAHGCQAWLKGLFVNAVHDCQAWFKGLFVKFMYDCQAWLKGLFVHVGSI